MLYIYIYIYIHTYHISGDSSSEVGQRSAAASSGLKSSAAGSNELSRPAREVICKRLNMPLGEDQ